MFPDNSFFLQKDKYLEHSCVPWSFNSDCSYIQGKICISLFGTETDPQFYFQ